MEELQRSGRTVVGLEASQKYCEILWKKGLQVRQGFIEELSSDCDKVAAVYLNNVFEHLAKPDKALLRLAGVLRPDGKIITLQPTAYLGPLLARIYLALYPGRDVPDMGGWLASPYHITLISPFGMDELCARLGLKLVKVYSAPTLKRRGIAELIGLALQSTNRLGVRLSWRWPLVPSHCYVIAKESGDKRAKNTGKPTGTSSPKPALEL
jgi:SAM-dependent methyltransferase